MAREPSVTERVDTPLGRYVVKRMGELGIGWTEVARRAGLSVEGIKGMCEKDSNPQHDSKVKLAQALESPLWEIDHYFFQEEPIPTQPVEESEPVVMAYPVSGSQLMSKVQIVWEAYRAIAEKAAQDTSIPRHLQPSSGDIALMARAVLESMNSPANLGPYRYAGVVKAN